MPGWVEDKKEREIEKRVVECERGAARGEGEGERVESECNSEEINSHKI